MKNLFYVGECEREFDGWDVECLWRMLVTPDQHTACVIRVVSVYDLIY